MVVYFCCCSGTKSCPELCNPMVTPHGMDCSMPGFPCPLLAPEACSNSCALSQWCHPTISSSVTPFSLPSIFPSIRVFSNESALHIRGPKYWSFSTSPSKEYTGLISSRIEWFNLLVTQGTQESSAPQFENINSLVLSLLYSPTFTSIHNYWKSHSFDYIDLCWQSNVSGF